ncbi:hypothetical protein Tco_1367992 [Tanacetum coccineum]
MENIMYFNNGAGPSSSVGILLTQEEAEKRALAHNISMRYEILEEVRPVIETLAYNDKYKKLLDEIWADKVRFQPDLRLRTIKLGSLPAKLRDVEWKPDSNYAILILSLQLGSGKLRFTLGTYDHEVGSSRAKRSRNVETVKKALLLDVHHEFLEWRGCSREAKSCYNSRLETLLPKLIYSPQIMDWQLLHKIGCGDEIDQMRLGLYHAEELNEEGFDAYFQGGLRSDENFNAREYLERITIDRDLHLSRSSITSVRFLILREKKSLTEETIRSMSTLVYYRDLDRTTMRELIDSEDRLIPDIPNDDVPRVAA